MNRNRMFVKWIGALVALVLALGPVLSLGAQRASAQEAVPLVVSVSPLWEDVLTDEVLAAFEAQHPGVDVIVTYSDAMFFGFGEFTSSIEDQLDSTEERVMAADVVYIDSSSLTAADTQAGYFLDLAPLVASDPAMNSADFVPAAWQSYQWDGGMWALPLSMDVILLTYDPAAFDAAGLAYPNERWTVDDFATAARALTEYNADGSVSVPGFATVSGGNNLAILLRALAGMGLYDPATMPNAPLFSNPTLEHVLDVAVELVEEGVVMGGGGGLRDDIPLRVEGINGYGFTREDSVRYATLLPGGTAGLNVQGFAVSAGTQQPELAYALASFLTTLPELANNTFSAAPARYSLAETETGAPAQPPGPGGMAEGGAPGGGAAVSVEGGGPGAGSIAISSGPGGFFMGGLPIPDVIQPVVDQALTVALPVSELRYASYLSAAANEMRASGVDARSALQAAEVSALTDMQTAVARAGTVDLFVTPPEPEPELAPGEIRLTCAVNQGGIAFGPGGRQLINQEAWDALVEAFVANDPVVGDIVLEPVQEQDLTLLAGQYDCFILPSNAVEGADTTPLLSLDPLIDSDVTFDRNDVIGSTLAQLQQDNKTWALPLAVQPQLLQYNREKFAQAGVPEPVDGWTVDAFVDALRMLKPYDTDPAPYQPNDPSGAYLLMLIAAFGGLPIDYRTDPPTINFTDPATVDAIRQVLDLAVAGYIDYAELSNFGVVEINLDDLPPISSDMFGPLRRPMRPDGTIEADPQGTALYPQGSQYNPLAYEITTGYISATAQNPDAAYRFLSEVARSPQVLSGMPARASLASDPAVIAAQGEDVAALYQQLDALLRAPNTIVFPTFGIGRGGGGMSMMLSNWLRQAMDSYVTEGADLETALAEAEALTLAYLECVAQITLDTSTDAVMPGGEQFRQMAECAALVDPSFGQGQ
ncbi:MAG: extracellular solute-binding protein [Chloroflexi bacterium]|nr:extracellular solute-binding protein [Chloroflexota bacterium]